MIFFVLILMSVVTADAGGSGAQPDTGFMAAPLNPAFLEHQAQNPPGAKALMQSGEHATGFIPSPVMRTHLIGTSARSLSAASSYPTSYDLRTQGKLSPVRDQGSCGSCWAFATYGSMESVLWYGNVPWLFSENNMKNLSGFDWGVCAGGNNEMSTAYLARWSGPVSEADDPYNESSTSSDGGLPIKGHAQEVIFLGDRTGPLDNDGIKEAVMTWGGVTLGMYMDDSATNGFYNPSTYAYNTGATSGTYSENHQVTIVGWDDSFSRDNFTKTPAGDGAFIIKNSWGTGWGDKGFFYISYYELSAMSYMSVFNSSESTLNYKYIYQYDTLGWVTSLGSSTGKTAWAANVFTASNENTERIMAASFYTTDINSTYDLTIYTNLKSSKPDDGDKSSVISGSFPLSGYHTVALDSLDITVAKGSNFSVVVKLTNVTYPYPVAVEARISDYSSKATASKKSYMSENGITWEEVSTIVSNSNPTNACLKVFTSPTCYSGKPCVEDTIQGSTCTHTNMPVGTVCDDGNPGTISDKCDGNGNCTGDILTCTPGQCDQFSVPNKTGCYREFLPAGTDCTYSEPCYRYSRCDSKGDCMKGIPEPGCDGGTPDGGQQGGSGGCSCSVISL